jgi:hypothetical protein
MYHPLALQNSHRIVHMHSIHISNSTSPGASHIIIKGRRITDPTPNTSSWVAKPVIPPHAQATPHLQTFRTYRTDIRTKPHDNSTISQSFHTPMYTRLHTYIDPRTAVHNAIASRRNNPTGLALIIGGATSTPCPRNVLARTCSRPFVMHSDCRTMRDLSIEHWRRKFAAGASEAVEKGRDRPCGGVYYVQ